MQTVELTSDHEPMTLTVYTDSPIGLILAAERYCEAAFHKWGTYPKAVHAECGELSKWFDMMPRQFLATEKV